MNKLTKNYAAEGNVINDIADNAGSNEEPTAAQARPHRERELPRRLANCELVPDK